VDALHNDAQLRLDRYPQFALLERSACSSTTGCAAPRQHLAYRCV